MIAANSDYGRHLMDVVVWLRSLGLEKYEAAFREHEITEKVLPNLTAEDLKELGVAALGHRRTLLDAIAALHSDAGVRDSARCGSSRSTVRCNTDLGARRGSRWRAPTRYGDVLRLSH